MSSDEMNALSWPVLVPPSPPPASVAAKRPLLDLLRFLCLSTWMPGTCPGATAAGSLLRHVGGRDD